MRRIVRHRLERFRRDESGQIAIEFVLIVPLLFSVFLSSIELGIYSMRQMWLDRGLDIAVREVRLSTGNAPDHDALKDIICEQAPFLPDCNARLKLEMVLVDPTAFAGLPAQPDCVDVEEEVNTPPDLIQGGNNQLMMLRACLVFDPIVPTTGLGFAWSERESLPFMTSTSAFVQEPVTE